MNKLRLSIKSLVITLAALGSTVAIAQDKKNNKPKYILHKANTRGGSQADWLRSNHTFSFNDYYDPERMNFGALRVLNDDWIKGGSGFGMHPHRDMEIITIPLHGSLAHEDTKGGKGVIRANGKTFTIQTMTAGTGIYHSEKNGSETDSSTLLQIWVNPDKRGLTPSYGQKDFEMSAQKGKWLTIVAPDDAVAMPIHQRSWFVIGEFKKGEHVNYTLHDKRNGLYLFLIEGGAKWNGMELNRRDGIGIWNTDKIALQTTAPSRYLIMEVPMKD
ncbi:MAG: pirin family protein [Sphingobacteriales bacterium]|nr:MAG: pirin family protein [Sphingobacteriales bacterium]